MRRQVLLVYALLLVEAVAFTGFFPVSSLFVEELSLSVIQMAAVFASVGVAIVVVSVPVGVLTDRLGARRLTVAAGALMALSAAGQGLAVGFWSLLVSRAALGIAAATILTAGLAWLEQLVPEERRQPALAAVMPVIGAGMLAGPSLAGTLADRFGLATPFLLVAGAGLAVTLVLALAEAGAKTPMRREAVLPTLGLLSRQPLVRGALVIVLLAGTAESTINLLAPLRLGANGVSASAIGAIFSAAAVLFFLVSAAVTRLASRAVQLRVGSAGALALAAVVFPLAASQSTAAVSGGVIARMAVLGVLWTIAFPLAALGAARAGLGAGAAFGLLMVAIGIANIAGPVVGGTLAEALGDRWAYAALVAAAVVVAGWLSGLASSPRRRGYRFRLRLPGVHEPRERG